MSAKGRTFTFMKFPSVSSMTSRKSYLSASLRSLGRFADRKRGFEGNSVKSARTGGFDGSRKNCLDRIVSSSSIEASVPWPKW